MADSMRIGLIGVGNAAKIHLRGGYWREPFVISSLCDNAQVLSALDGFSVGRDPDFLIRDKSIDIMIVATPPATHYSLVESSLNAGKHVIVEKPTALSFDDVRILTNIAREKRRAFVTHFNRRWDGDFLAVKGAVSSGLLGQVHFIESRVADSYSGQRAYPGRHQWKLKGLGGGILFDWAPHLFDQLFDLVSEHPKGLYCSSSRPNGLVDHGLEEQFFVEVHFERFVAHISASWNFMVDVPRWCVAGLSGALRVDHHESGSWLMRIRRRHADDVLERDTLISKETDSSCAEDFCSHFQRCLAAPDYLREEEQRTLLVAHAIDLVRESIQETSFTSWTGRLVDLS